MRAVLVLQCVLVAAVSAAAAAAAATTTPSSSSTIPTARDSNIGTYTAAPQHSATDGVLEYDLTFHPTANASSFMPSSPIFPKLAMSIDTRSSHSLRITILPAAEARWRVPLPLNWPPSETASASEPPAYAVQVQADGSVAVSRTPHNEVITTLSLAVFSNQYLELWTTLPTDHIYGLGERDQQHLDLATDTTYSIFSSDRPLVGATKPTDALYGSHPVYLAFENARVPDDSGASPDFSPPRAHGVFLLNSNAMAVQLRGRQLAFRAVGGVVDAFVYLGPAPAHVISQHQTLVGLPFVPPFWALGFHQCRYGTANISEQEWVVEQFNARNIPLTTSWMDIDYMDQKRDWTFDPVKFPVAEVAKFTDSLHARGQKLVTIVDPGIYVPAPSAAADEYPTYNRLLASGACIRDPTSPDDCVLGKVWPGITAFPDWSHPNASAWWQDEIQRFHDMVKVDGLWTDMNEPVSFCDGSCVLNRTQEAARGGLNFTNDNLFSCACTSLQTLPPAAELLDFPPFLPPSVGNKRAVSNLTTGLSKGTLSMASTYYQDPQAAANGTNTHYNRHSLFGHHEAMATAAALQTVRSTRPFVLTRSSFAGTGHHAAHWLGDNESTFLSFRQSIVGVLIALTLNSFNLAGPDICGFNSQPDQHLCLRWMQMSTFYPFSRNHNAINMRDQYPFTWPDVEAASRKALMTRYALLLHMYSRVREASLRGYPVLRPLSFEFADALNHTTANDEQLLFGRHLMVAPVLYPDTETVQPYFPGTSALWFDMRALVQAGRIAAGADVAVPVYPSGAATSVSAKTTEETPYFLRSGGLAFVNEQTGAVATIASARSGNMTVVVAILPRGRNVTVKGAPFETHEHLFLDDGESLDGSAYLDLHFQAVHSADHTLTLRVASETATYAPPNTLKIHRLAVLGCDLDAAPGSAGANTASMSKPTYHPVEWHFADATNGWVTDIACPALGMLPAHKSKDHSSSKTIVIAACVAAVAVVAVVVVVAMIIRKRRARSSAYTTLNNSDGLPSDPW